MPHLVRCCVFVLCRYEETNEDTSANSLAQQEPTHADAPPMGRPCRYYFATTEFRLLFKGFSNTATMAFARGTCGRPPVYRLYIASIAKTSNPTYDPITALTATVVLNNVLSDSSHTMVTPVEEILTI